jgi:hypothetical protein
LRGPPLDHVLISELVDAGVPLGWDELVATVVVEDAEEVEEMDEEELLRCMCFLGMKMPRTSSLFIGLMF